MAKERESAKIDSRIMLYRKSGDVKRRGLKMTKETIEQVLKFRDERDWKQFHNPKDLAISICLEAAELLHFNGGYLWT